MDITNNDFNQCFTHTFNNPIQYVLFARSLTICLPVKVGMV